MGCMGKTKYRFIYENVKTDLYIIFYVVIKKIHDILNQL